jgi:hypothetical protein
LKKERIRVTLVEKRKKLTYDKYAVTASINGLGDKRRGFIQTSSFYTEKNIVIQPWSSSVDHVPVAGVSDIISATPLSGYLPTHNKYTSDLTTGMQNSYYIGCKNTADTTIDGAPPVEVFVTNPNVIKVIGRDNNEPILGVE